MAITTLDQALAGMQYPRPYLKGMVTPGGTGRIQTAWGVTSVPGAGTWDTTLNGVTLSSSAGNVAGQIPFSDPASGNTYLARFSGTTATTAGSLYLADRLWHNGGINATLTTAQTIVSPTWPARDATGSTAGVGVNLAVEFSTNMGAATPTITISYTNSSGVAGRTSTNIDPTYSSAFAGNMCRMSLQNGDVGVQSVQSITLSASYVSGTINIVAYRLIASLELPQVGSGAAIDALTSGFPRLYNGSVPYLYWVSNANNSTIVAGSVVWTQG